MGMMVVIGTMGTMETMVTVEVIGAMGQWGKFRQLGLAGFKALNVADRSRKSDWISGHLGRFVSWAVSSVMHFFLGSKKVKDLL